MSNMKKNIDQNKESENVRLHTRYDFHEDSSDHLYDAVDILCNSKTLPFDGNAITQGRGNISIY